MPLFTEVSGWKHELSQLDHAQAAQAKWGRWLGRRVHLLTIDVDRVHASVIRRPVIAPDHGRRATCPNGGAERFFHS